MQDKIKVMEIKITQNIKDYIKDHRSRFEFPMPRTGEIWKLERVVKYPSCNNGDPVIEMHRKGKKTWMRIPAHLVFSRDYTAELLK